MRQFALAIYSDDMGFASAGFNEVIREISDDLGAMLGMIFKWQKDVIAATTMDYIGFEISIENCKIFVRAKQKSRIKLRGLLN
jgi:hypothetical protein